MDFNRILTTIFTAADYDESKQKEFSTTFYTYLFMKVIAEIHQIDEVSARELETSLINVDKDPKQAGFVWRKLAQRPELKARMDKVLDEVVNDLVTDIAESATAEQKKKILELLPN